MSCEHSKFRDLVRPDFFLLSSESSSCVNFLLPVAIKPTAYLYFKKLKFLNLRNKQKY